jgi:hypothetical protein
MKLRLKWIVAVVACYFLGYVLNSYFGSYRWTASGHSRRAFGVPTLISSLDTKTWFPAIGGFDVYLTIHGQEATRGDLVGYVFSPLIRLDRRYFHRSRRVMDENGFPLPHQVVVDY